MLGVTEVDQRIEARHRFEHDVTALAAIAAIRATIFDEFFAPEADGSGAARARTYEDLGLVEEMHASGGLRDARGERRRPQRSANNRASRHC